MPTYTVKNIKTDETYDVSCKYSELQEILKVEGIEQVITVPHVIGAVGGHSRHTDDGWKDTLKQIKKNNPGSTIKV